MALHVEGSSRGQRGGAGRVMDKLTGNVGRTGKARLHTAYGDFATDFSYHLLNQDENGTECRGLRREDGPVWYE